MPTFPAWIRNQPEPLTGRIRWARGQLRAGLRQRRRSKEHALFLQNTAGQRRFPHPRAHVFYQALYRLATTFNAGEVLLQLKDASGLETWVIHGLWRARQTPSGWVMEERQNIAPYDWEKVKKFPPVPLWPIEPGQLSTQVSVFQSLVMEKLKCMALREAERRWPLARSQHRKACSWTRMVFGIGFGQSSETLTAADLLAFRVASRRWKQPGARLGTERLRIGHLLLRKQVWHRFLSPTLLQHWGAVHLDRVALLLPSVLSYQAPGCHEAMVAWQEQAPHARPLLLHGPPFCSPEQAYEQLLSQCQDRPPSPPEASLDTGSAAAGIQVPRLGFPKLAFSSQAVLDRFWTSPAVLIKKAVEAEYLTGVTAYWELSPKAHHLLEDLTVPQRGALVQWLAERDQEKETLFGKRKRGRPSTRSLWFQSSASPVAHPLTLLQMEKLLLQHRLVERKRLNKASGKRRPRSRQALASELDLLSQAYDLVLKLSPRQRRTWLEHLPRSHPWASQKAHQTLDKALPAAAVEQAPKRARF